MHTEGSVIFADPEIYDKKNTWKENYKWKHVLQTLIPENSEPCASSLLSIFDPLHSDDGKYYLEMDPLQLTSLYLEGNLKAFVSKTISAHADKNFTQDGLEKQINWNLEIIASIENYLLAHWDNSEGITDTVKKLAMNTLAYYLADEKQKENLVELFKVLATNIQREIPESQKRIVFGKTLYGTRDVLVIENWVKENLFKILESENTDELLSTLWPLLKLKISNSSFLKCDIPEILVTIARKWIAGNSFYNILQTLQSSGAKMNSGTRKRNYNVEHVVDICENALAYDGSLLLGAIVEIIRLIKTDMGDEVIGRLQLLQKQLKYGLTNPNAIALYEMGFSDRIISKELCAIIDEDIKPYRATLIKNLKKKELIAKKILNKYPAYFSHKFELLGFSEALN